jgi:hypothetical protein
MSASLTHRYRTAYEVIFEGSLEEGLGSTGRVDAVNQIAKAVRRRGLHDVDGPLYGHLTPEERVGLLETMRAEYYGWDDETQPRLERVCRVLRRS